MIDSRRTQVPTTYETPVTSIQRSKFRYRYAYARALETRNAGDSGQDYIAILEDDNRLAFALCDGVSQSFYGDLAAHILGDALIKWMFQLDENLPTEEISQRLHQHLQLLVPAATKMVQEFKVPDNLHLMLQKALDQKRIIGSESTMISGCVDITSQRFVFVWMGDSILRIWGSSGEKTSSLGNSFQKSERWSSSKGCVGQIHVIKGQTQEFSHFAAYSDGLINLNDVQEWDDLNNQFIDTQIKAAGEDDMSFFEFWIDPPIIPIQKVIEIPINLYARLTNSELEVFWDACKESSFYQVELQTKQGDVIHKQTKLPSFKLPLADIPEGLLSIRVRNVQGNLPGKWSGKVVSQVLKAGSGSGNGSTPPVPPIPPKRRNFRWMIALACLLAVVSFLLGFLAGVKVANNRVTPTLAISITEAINYKSTSTTPSAIITQMPTLTFTLTPLPPTLTNTDTQIVPTQTYTVTATNTDRSTVAPTPEP